MTWRVTGIGDAPHVSGVPGPCLLAGSRIQALVVMPAGGGACWWWCPLPLAAIQEPPGHQFRVVPAGGGACWAPAATQEPLGHQPCSQSYFAMLPVPWRMCLHSVQGCFIFSS